MATTAESRRFAADQAGLIHELADYLPARGAYTALCGAVIPARSSLVQRGQEPPGILCKACRAKTIEEHA